jgi:hypothetical protein
MRRYAFTERGQKLAKDLGLDDLANKIYKEGKSDFISGLVDDDYHSLYYDASSASEEAGAIQEVCSALRSIDDQIYVERVLTNIHPEADFVPPWLYETGVQDGDERLFPISEHRHLTSADVQVDRLVLSGMVGLHLRKRHALRSVLSEWGFARHGFSNRVDAAAFAGAYILSGLNDRNNEIRLLKRESDMPSLEVSSGAGIRHTISLGGSFHGDFRMYQTAQITKGGITPTGVRTLFAPERTIGVAGYHSVEPSITDAMLECAYLQGGEERLLGIMADLYEAAHDFIQKKNAPLGADPFFVPRFADYGGGGIDYSLSWLRLMKDDKYDYKYSKNLDSGESVLFGGPYLPQASTDMQIVATHDGLVFRNSSEDEVGEEITVPNNYFSDLFKALLIQSQQGLGRTSPDQHLQIIQKCRDLLVDGVMFASRID